MLIGPKLARFCQGTINRVRLADTQYRHTSRFSRIQHFSWAGTRHTFPEDQKVAVGSAPRLTINIVPKLSNAMFASGN